MAGLQAESKKRGIPFKEALNSAIRAGLQAQEGLRNEKRPFKVKAFGYAIPRPGINFDCTSELLAMDEKLP